MRDVCERCKQNPKAINYKKDNRVYYRRLCDSCLIKKKKEVIPIWQQEKYKKKFKCESCEFVAKTQEQLSVYKISGAWRTVCLNCEALLRHTGKIDIKKDLRSDF